MSRTPFTVLLALCVVALPASIALAQRFPFASRGQDITHFGRATDADVETCQSSGGGSRVRSNCDDPPTSRTAAVQQAAKIAIPALAQPNAPTCAATTVTEYLQRETMAHVNGTITVKSCPAGSAGTYEIVLRVKDGTGAIKPLELSEKWEESEAAYVAFAADYPLGEQVELLDVRVRNLRCTCAESAQPPAQSGDGN